MAKLALIYGMRLFAGDDLGEVKEATVVLKSAGPRAWQCT